jgi:preprotein translocase subunit SecE
MSKIITYFENAYDELLHKVTWPSWKELQETTAIVLLCIALLTALVFIMDAASEVVFQFIYKLVN